MIEILRTSEKGLEVLKEVEQDCWINVTSPTDEEMAHIKSMLSIPKELLLSLKDIDEVPANQHYEKFTFITIRAPFNSQKKDLEYYTVPIGIFSAKKFVLTISFFENEAISKLKEQKFKFRKTHLVFRLLLISAKLYLTYLSEMKNKMYGIETELGSTQKNEVIMRYLEIQKSMVYFNTAIRSNGILIERIASESRRSNGITKYGIKIKTSQDQELINRVIDENNQAIQMIDIYSNILSSTIEAFASVISNNLNVVIKVLTSITIVLSFPILVASIYGMNISLPFQQSPDAFAIVMVISGFLSLASVAILWKLKSF